jgi:hypothetical protein
VPTIVRLPGAFLSLSAVLAFRVFGANVRGILFFSLTFEVLLHFVQIASTWRT